MTPPERQNLINILWLIAFAVAGVLCCGGIIKIGQAFARVILEIG